MADEKTVNETNKNVTTDKNAPSAQSNPNPAAVAPRKGEDAPKKEDVGAAPHLVQNPVDRNPSEVADEAIQRVEVERIARENQEREEMAKELPQKTIDEIEAGREALKRHGVAAPQAVSKE